MIHRECDTPNTLINAAYAGYEVDESRWPNLVGLVARVRAQPQVAAVLEKEQRALGLD